MNHFFAKCSIAILSIVTSQLAFAVAPLFISASPVKQIISYGATNMAITLQYDLVSNLPNESQVIGDIKFASTSPTSNITLTSINSSCNGVIPPQGPTGVCTIFVNLTVSGIQPPSHTAISPVSYQLTFTYGNGRGTTLASSPVVFNFATGNQITTASRTFTFVNNCNYDVWLGMNAGATNSIIPVSDPQSCLTNNDCYPGSTCVSVGPSLNHCFWNNPTTANGVYKLTASGGTNTITLPVYDNGIESVWSGGIAGRTACTATSCDTGDCVDPSVTVGHDGACQLTKGFSAPVSTSEFTLLASNASVYTNTLNGNTVVDTYDATVINGVTTPISMTPSNGIWGGKNSPYSCGVAGAATNAKSSAACDWTGFIAPDYTYVFVKYDAAAINCTDDSVCGANKCGSSFNPTGSLVLTGKCGAPLGYWTADGICAKQSNYTNATNGITCGAVVGPGSATQTELYGCTGNPYANSCYSAGAVSDECCGCVDWSTISGINVPPSPITASCNGISSTPWVTYSQPKLEWLKKACPNAYVFPFDDASSTFTCEVLNSDKINVVNYTIEFCPVV